MPKWNEQQRRAVEIRERNILVSASAGSGKTTVLVGRLMDLVLKDGISVDQILAMTFTEAAANEMKKRLSAALQDAARESEDEAVKARLNRQLTLMQSAQISTIHSFCLSILQSYYYIIGCTARQIATIADNAQTQRFQQQAMANTLRLHQGEALNALRARFSARPGDDAPLCGAIRSLAALASSKPDPDAWLQSCALPY
ncbi:MAG: UvrD-helicase domain-containing protein, partial [Merdibacter sp.]|nr:UvrD-helicase domain-containing protein [Merdibacter sp.]